jgi:hypothetical protein
MYSMYPGNEGDSVLPVCPGRERRGLGRPLTARAQGPLLWVGGWEKMLWLPIIADLAGAVYNAPQSRVVFLVATPLRLCICRTARTRLEKKDEGSRKYRL